MNASEFARIFDLKIVRCDKFDSERGYLKYKVIYIPSNKLEDRTEKAIIESSFTLEGLLSYTNLYYRTLKYIAMTNRLLGFNEHDYERTQRISYEDKIRFTEALEYFRADGTLKKLPVTQLMEILFGDGHFEDDISEGLGFKPGFSTRVIVQKWFSRRSENWQQEVLKEMGFSSLDRLTDALSRSLDKIFPAVMTKEDIKMVEDTLGRKHKPSNAAQILTIILKNDGYKEIDISDYDDIVFDKSGDNYTEFEAEVDEDEFDDGNDEATDTDAA